MSLKELGLSLEEIKSVVTGGHFSPLEIVSLQIARLKETIRIQQKLLAELEYVSNQMHFKQHLTVEDFTKLLEMMIKSHEKMILKRRMTWEHRLNLLGDFRDKDADESNHGS